VKKVTITLDEAIARRATFRAVELGISLSSLVEEMIREKMREEQTYQAAKHHYLFQQPRKLKKPGARYARREELHER